jgi:hypothetical protein
LTWFGDVVNDLSPAERAELDRLRNEVATLREAAATYGRARWRRGVRWVAATAVLLVAGILATAAVTAVYLRAQVLNTDSYMQTVAPLGVDPAVRAAVANRLTAEIITRSDIQDVTTSLGDNLVARGAPSQVHDLVNPVVSALSSFVNRKVNEFLTTKRFETAWININRVAHEGLVTVLTGRQGQFLTSQGDTVTLDLGELLSLAKQRLVEEGLTTFGKIPDVSISYTLIQSKELPKIRTYARMLDAAGTWLPWVALATLVAGVLIAPNRRRGIVLGWTFVGVVAVVALAALAFARTYYVDHPPASVGSPEAAEVTITTVLRYLVASLQTLIVVSIIFVLGGLLAGPSTPAVAIRRVLGRGLDAAASGLRHSGTWAGAVGRGLGTAYHWIQIGLVLVAVAIFILADRPGISAVLWTTAAVLAVLLVLEILVRAGKPTAREASA